MKEIWRDVDKYEGSYQVSNLGRIKSVYRIDNNHHIVKERILNQMKNWSGYMRVALSKNGKVKKHSVHRLVAKAFIPNPLNKPQVNHKDETRDNNCVDNLNWMTAKENSNYGSRNSNVLLNVKKKIKAIYNDNTYEIWDSATDYARENHCGNKGVSLVLRGKRKSYFGVRFEYVEE